MKSIFKTTVLGACLSLFALASQAASFNFSYSFDPANTSTGGPVIITGSFSGNAVGNLISDISNVVLSINGTAFQGPIVVEAADASGFPSTSVAPVISSDLGLTNFVFADVDMVSHSDQVSNFFTLSNGTAYALNLNILDAGSNALAGYESASNASWTVAAAPVPEPSAVLLMAGGLGFLGLRQLRRSKT